ncbi:hypothetical protein CFP59_08949 [Streptomyces malaysiensis subsp. malaysiensis]|nr:hypothetical protein CFP59_08949 [Streptomyces sp. M56]
MAYAVFDTPAIHTDGPCASSLAPVGRAGCVPGVDIGLGAVRESVSALGGMAKGGDGKAEPR